jgi:hypothetical protein
MFLLWFIFAIGCFIAPFMAILLPIFKHNTYIRHFVMSADRMCAAMLGFSGRVTLSTECNHAMRYFWLHNVLNDIEENHCEDSAYGEGAYCRLSDRQLGDK